MDQSNPRPPPGALKLLKKKIKRKQHSSPKQHFVRNNSTPTQGNANYSHSRMHNNFSMTQNSQTQRPSISELDQLHSLGDARHGKPSAYAPPINMHQQQHRVPQQNQQPAQMHQQQHNISRKQQSQPLIQMRKQQQDRLPVMQKSQSKFQPSSLTNNVKSQSQNIIFKNKLDVVWTCNHCKRECIPVRGESRCLCGHRYKEHKGKNFSCSHPGCKCRKFFFVVAEGAWILRCRCKHKHIDHDPVTLKCKKRNCKACTGFDSPWVCNCGHPWSEHTQGTKVRKIVVVDGKEIPASMFAAMMGSDEDGAGGIAPEINNVRRDPMFGKQMYGNHGNGF